MRDAELATRTIIFIFAIDVLVVLLHPFHISYR
jgi:hypothetical protein